MTSRSSIPLWIICSESKRDSGDEEDGANKGVSGGISCGQGADMSAGEREHRLRGREVFREFSPKVKPSPPR
jgi:hypothetical protein